MIALLALSAILVSQSAVQETKPNPAFKNVSSGILTSYNKHSAQGLDTLLLVDSVGQSSSQFRTIRSKLKSLGGSLFKGKLNAQDVASLSGVAGISLDQNRAVSVNPPTGNATTAQSVTYLTDAAASVPQTDPALADARATNNVDGTGVLVAILDTGVDSNAVGLGNGKVVHREDFTAACPEDTRLDPYGHGTHVASIVAGASDARDPSIEGVAPGANILDLRVLDCEGRGTMGSIDEALQWILDHRVEYPVNVINMSLGTSSGPQDGRDPTSILINRVVAQGILVSIGAGNDGEQKSKLYQPATAEFATTVAAATVNKYGKYLAAFSSQGPTSDGRPGIDITAPGGGIIAALTTADPSGDTSTIKSGTSMSAPYVAGLAALLLQQHPSLAPSGSVCDLSVDCPSGVVAASMTNSLQDSMKTSDWFESGIDSVSGAGMVSASDSLNGSTPALTTSLGGAIDSESPNQISISPHSQATSMTLILNESFEFTSLGAKIVADHNLIHLMQVDDSYQSIQLKSVATLLSATAKMAFSDHGPQRIFNVYLPPSNVTTNFVISSAQKTSYRVNIDSFDGDVALSNGVLASRATLDANGNAVVTLTRTIESAKSDDFDVALPSTISGPYSVTLAAGPIGTTATLPISRTSATDFATEKVIFKQAGGRVLASAVATRADGDGLIQYPNPYGTNTSGESPNAFLADDGSILGSARADGISNSSGYASAFRIDPNSLVASQYKIAQPTDTEINSVGYSQDGSTGLFAIWSDITSPYFPGSRNLSSSFYVKKLTGGEKYQIAADDNSGLEQSYPQLNEDGSQIAAVHFNSSSDKPVELVVVSGETYSQSTKFDSFAINIAVRVEGFSHGRILVRVWDKNGLIGDLAELRVYKAPGEYEVVPQSNYQSSGATFSADGQAVGYIDVYTAAMRCYVKGSLVTFADKAKRFGTPYADVVAVADDCSWVIANWETSPNSVGRQLLKIGADGSVTRLDIAAQGYVHWASNLAGTKFMRITDLSLEPGDLNGTVDIYRGLRQSAALTLINPTPSLTFEAPTQALTFGSSLALAATSNSRGNLSFKVVAGSCHITGQDLVADSGVGTCEIAVDVAETSIWDTSESKIKVNLKRANRPVADVGFKVASEFHVNQTPEFTFDNPNGEPYSISVEGVCAISISAQTSATWLAAVREGSCTLIAEAAQDNNFEASKIETIITVLAKLKDQPWIEFPNPLAYEPGPAIPLDYGTGVNLSAWSVSSGDITISVISGDCHITGHYLFADAGSGDCTVKADLAETESWAPASKSFTIELSKAHRSVDGVAFTAPDTLRFNQSPEVIFANPRSEGYVISTSGPCQVVGSKIVPTALGYCRLKATFPEDSHYLSSEVSAGFWIINALWSDQEFGAAENVAQLDGATFSPSFINTTGLVATIHSVNDDCSVANSLVTMATNSTGICALYVTLASKENYEEKTVYLYVPRATTPPVDPPAEVVVTPIILDQDWSASKTFAKGTTLSANANIFVAAGYTAQCSATQRVITFKSASGVCRFNIGGYKTDNIRYESVAFSISLGPATQAWTAVLPKYTTKKLASAKFAFITNGQPKTTLGLTGRFTATNGCKITKSGKNVTVNLGKLKRCSVGLSAPAGFRVPAISRTWTFSR